MSTFSVLPRLAITALAATLLVIGCKKEQKNNSTALSPQEEEQATAYSSQSEAEAQSAFDDVLNSVMGVSSDVGFGNVGIFGRTAETNRVERADSLHHCVKVTITPQQVNVFPKTVTMDFGSGCLIHGRLRSGKIHTTYTGRLTEPGKSATTTFENYRIDSVAVEGTKRITNTTTPGANQRQFKVEVINGKLTRLNGDYQEWNASRTHTQIEGNGTLSPSDDIYRITGTASGKAKRGSLTVSWSSEIQEPLIKSFACRWISKGTIKTVRTGSSGQQWTGLLDYGQGTCDNKATLTVNGNVHQIVLR